MHTQNFIKIHQLDHRILSINEISKSIKGHNSVENERNLSFNHPNLHLVNINAYTKFDGNPHTISQDIEHKQNSDIDQGPNFCEKLTKNNVHYNQHGSCIYQCINKILSKFIHLF